MTPCVGNHSERSEESIFRPVFKDDRPRASCNPILEKAFFDMEVSPSSYAPPRGCRWNYQHADLLAMQSTCFDGAHSEQGVLGDFIMRALARDTGWTATRVETILNFMTPKIIDETDLCQITAHTARKKSQRNYHRPFLAHFRSVFLKKFHFLFDPIKIIL